MRARFRGRAFDFPGQKKSAASQHGTPPQALWGAYSTAFLYCFFRIALHSGIASTTDAQIHAPGSPKHTAANAAEDAVQSTGAPLTHAGSHVHSTTRATSSATPAPST